MKRPYREGSRFAVPLGDGSVAEGVVARGTRKVLELGFAGPDPWCVRVSDRALREHRWPVLGTDATQEWPRPGNFGVLLPGIVERMLSARSRGERFEAPRVRVVDIGDRPHVPALPDGEVWVQWRRPLDALTFANVAAALHGRDARVRLHGEGAAQAASLAAWRNLVSLVVETSALPPALPTFESVRTLALDGVPTDLRALLASFPNVTALRVRARGAAFDVAALDRAPAVRGLDLRGASIVNAKSFTNTCVGAIDVRECTIADPDTLLALPFERVRLARVPNVRSIAALARNAALRVLALVDLTAFDDAGAIAHRERLESLELCGSWQFGVDDVAFVAEMPSLQRLRLDIGGRRKNAEIYRRRLFAEPLPFDVATGS